MKTEYLIMAVAVLIMVSVLGTFTATRYTQGYEEGYAEGVKFSLGMGDDCSTYELTCLEGFDQSGLGYDDSVEVYYNLSDNQTLCHPLGEYDSGWEECEV